MTTIIDTIDQLSAAWFTSALRVAGTIDHDTRVSAVTSQSIGTGQLGSVVRSELAYDGNDQGPASLIVKLPSRDQGSRALGTALGVYESEVRFYHEIAPHVAVAVPKVHWAAIESSTGRFTLILEDLTAVSTVGDMVAGGTVEQADLAIGELARLQAPLWNAPELRDDRWWGDHSRVAMLFAAAVPSLSEFERRFRDRVEPEYLKLARRLSDKATTVVEKLWTEPLVVSHGDYRLDNMMFASSDDGPPLAVIDWQATRLGPPMFDAAMFTGACLDTADRRAHERDLLDSYLENLHAGGVSDFSAEDCWQGYRAGSLFPFLMVIGASVALERTERGDQMWSRLIRGCGDLVLDTAADELLD